MTDDLNLIRITPQEDIVGMAKSYPHVPETEILLYDIYVRAEESNERSMLEIVGRFRQKTSTTQ